MDELYKLKCAYAANNSKLLFVIYHKVLIEKIYPCNHFDSRNNNWKEAHAVHVLCSIMVIYVLLFLLMRNVLLWMITCYISTIWAPELTIFVFFTLVIIKAPHTCIVYLTFESFDWISQCQFYLWLYTVTSPSIPNPIFDLWSIYHWLILVCFRSQKCSYSSSSFLRNVINMWAKTLTVWSPYLFISRENIANRSMW